MPTKRVRRRRYRGDELLRPSVQAFLDSGGDTTAISRDNPWMLLDLTPRVRAALLEAHARGDHVEVRRVLVKTRICPDFFFR